MPANYSSIRTFLLFFFSFNNVSRNGEIYFLYPPPKYPEFDRTINKDFYFYYLLERIRFLIFQVVFSKLLMTNIIDIGKMRRNGD